MLLPWLFPKSMLRKEREGARDQERERERCRGREREQMKNANLSKHGNETGHCTKNPALGGKRAAFSKN